MQLHYPQKQNGMYVLSKLQIEEIATAILMEYAPSNLFRPTPLDTKDFLENYLGLTIKNQYIGSMNSGILGLIVMNDMVEIPSYDEKMQPTIIEETFGTVLISPHLNSDRNLPRRRYTEVHEASHFILHKAYFQNLEALSNKAVQKACIACRQVELHIPSPKSVTEWMEWQADTLASSLLMPQEVFYYCVKSNMHNHNIDRDYLLPDSCDSTRVVYQIVAQTADYFGVSKRAAYIRMNQLNMIKNIDLLF